MKNRRAWRGQGSQGEDEVIGMDKVVEEGKGFGENTMREERMLKDRQEA